MSELREALESAVNDAETAETTSPPPEQPSSESLAPPSGDESQGAAGDASPPAETQAGTDGGKPEDGTAPAKPEATAKSDEQKPGEPKPETAEERRHRVDRAPQSWKGDAKGEWAALPLRVRQEITKREAEINRVMSESSTARQVAGELSKVISPYMARIKSYNVSPLQAVDELFKADYILGTGSREERAEHMAKLIKSYSIDLDALDQALVRTMGGQPQGGGQAPGGQDIEQRVMQRVQELLNPVTQMIQQNQQVQQQQARQVQEEANMTVEQMSLDPKYTYFEEVRQDMADLIELSAKRGVYLSLEDAYTKAVGINPQLSQSASAATLHQQAQRARNASVSVSGAPAAGGSPAPANDGSLRGAIEAAFGGARV